MFCCFLLYSDIFLLFSATYISAPGIWICSVQLSLSMLCFLNSASSQTVEIHCAHDSHPGARTLSHFSNLAIHDSFLISFIHFLLFNLLFSSFLILPLSTLLILLHPSCMSWFLPFPLSSPLLLSLHVPAVIATLNLLSFSLPKSAAMHLLEADLHFLLCFNFDFIF